MDLNNVHSNEMIYRAVGNKPVFWKENGTISSALFKDSKGVSVDRGGGRNEKQIIEQLSTKFIEIKGVVCLTVGDCIDSEAIVLAKPLIDNLYHAEIHRSNEEVQLSNGQAKALARKWRLIKA